MAKAVDVTRQFLSELGNVHERVFTFNGETAEHKVAFRRDGTVNTLCSGLLIELQNRGFITGYEAPKRGRHRKSGMSGVAGSSRLSKKVLRASFWERYGLDHLEQAAAAIAAAKAVVLEREKAAKEDAIKQAYRNIKIEADRLGVELV